MADKLAYTVSEAAEAVGLGGLGLAFGLALAALEFGFDGGLQEVSLLFGRR